MIFLLEKLKDLWDKLSYNIYLNGVGGAFVIYSLTSGNTTHAFRYLRLDVYGSFMPNQFLLSMFCFFLFFLVIK